MRLQVLPSIIFLAGVGLTSAQTCTCPNGSERTDSTTTPCSADGNVECDSCNTDYWLDSGTALCQADCTCTGGTAVTGGTGNCDATNAGTNICASCDTGFWIDGETCYADCTCTGGTAVTGGTSPCTTANAGSQRCASCTESNYSVNDNDECVENSSDSSSSDDSSMSGSFSVFLHSQDFVVLALLATSAFICLN